MCNKHQIIQFTVYLLFIYWSFVEKTSVKQSIKQQVCSEKADGPPPTNRGQVYRALLLCYGTIYGTQLEITTSQHADAKQLSPPPKWSQQ